MNTNVVENLKPKELKAIDVAYNEFKKKVVNSEGYEISAFYRDSSLIVIFSKGTPVPGARGNLSQYPSFEVTVEMEKISVIESSFTR